MHDTGSNIPVLAVEDIDKQYKITKMVTTQAQMLSKLEAKHPVNYGITTHESNHCVLGHEVYAFVETEDERLHYSTDRAGRVRLVSRKALTPTYKSVRLQPKDCVVRVAGNNQYTGKFYVQTAFWGYDHSLVLADSIDGAHLMRRSDAEHLCSYLAFQAQHCYGRQFEVVPFNS